MTADSQKQMEDVMNSVMGLCVSNGDLPQHIIDSVVDLTSVIVILYQETEIGMLGGVSCFHFTRRKHILPLREREAGNGDLHPIMRNDPPHRKAHAALLQFSFLSRST